MKKLTVILLSSFILFGCASTVVEIEKPVVAHPSFPLPIKPRDVSMKTLKLEDKPYIIMTVKDSQNLNIYMTDMFRYIKDMKSMVCSYRRDLNEEYCKER